MEDVPILSRPANGKRQAALSGGLCYLRYRSDTHLSVLLSVTFLFGVAALLAVSDDADFCGPSRTNQFTGHLSTFDVGGTHSRLGPIVGEEHLVERDLGTGFVYSDVLNIENAVLRDNVLFSTCFNDGYLCHSRRTITRATKGRNSPAFRRYLVLLT